MGNFKVTLDRIEEGIAVLLVRDEESVRINIHLFLLPVEIKDGDILDITIARDVQETRMRRKEYRVYWRNLKTKIKTD